MKPHTSVTIIGEIAGTPERKAINGKDLTEFLIDGIGLRISAWEQRAREVPNSGMVVVGGYLATRSYKYEGKDRTSTDIRATSIIVVDPAATDDSEPF